LFSKPEKRIKSQFLKIFSVLLTAYIIFISPIYYKKISKSTIDFYGTSSFCLDNANKTDTLYLNTKLIERKIYMDFLHHRIFSEKKSVSFMQIMVNQEGKIMGCRPYKIRYVNYWSAEQSKQLIKRTHVLTNFDTKLTIFSLKFILE
jgi:predicted nucleic acid binding AN1-type Zn finger protein